MSDKFGGGEAHENHGEARQDGSGERHDDESKSGHEESAEDVEQSGQDLRRKWLLGEYPSPPDEEVAKKDARFSTSERGWVEYWQKRLIAETGKLPKAIESLLSLEKFSPDQIHDFQAYINLRSAAARFWWAKRRVMKHLREELARIDQGTDVPEKNAGGMREVSYDEVAGVLFVSRDADGNPIPFSDADVAADRLWGIRYRASKNVPRELWRKIRKKSAIMGARLEIDDLVNQELAEVEKIGLPTSSWSPEFLEKNPQAGVVAERMAQSLLMRLGAAHPELGLGVEMSNAVEDAELKYDFKITVRKFRRGVAVEGKEGGREEHVEAKRRLGVQFTINNSAVGKKERQISLAREQLGEGKYSEYIRRAVDDIVLVVVPLREFSDVFRKWVQDGRPPGGPEQYLPLESRIELVQKTLQGRLDIPREELAAMLSR